MASSRMRRVDEAIREVAADTITKEIKDPRVGFVTVTDVQTTPDLSSARIHVSIFNAPSGPEDCLEALNAAHGVIQSALASQLRMKRTPTVQFVIDTTPATAARLEEILESVDLRSEGDSE
ncbi:MAG: 30S ribosome-binding factor RbfA [Solirubrobacteraceae bacterium]|jgi:ribosome-binding factor A|nr:30S ribosome-binding factor RbfA [Solirubrobacteraceae bacterium]MDP5033500.1 30S ribosome-binding factor RbfA [Solirubrobacteraceae bacterium]